MRNSIYASRCTGFQFHQTQPSVELLRWCLSSILSEKSSKVILSFNEACYPGIELSEARTGCLKCCDLSKASRSRGPGFSCIDAAARAFSE